MSYTSAPWEYRPFHLSDGQLIYFLVAANDALSSDLLNDEDDDNAEENAKLASCAPELLEALEELTDLIATYHLDAQQDVFDSSCKAKDLIKRIKDNQ